MSTSMSSSSSSPLTEDYHSAVAEPFDCDREPFECDREPFDCDREPFECDREPFECDREPFECDREPFECDREPFECDREPYECDREPFECDREPLPEGILAITQRPRSEETFHYSVMMRESGFPIILPLPRCLRSVERRPIMIPYSREEVVNVGIFRVQSGYLIKPIILPFDSEDNTFDVKQTKGEHKLCAKRGRRNTTVVSMADVPLNQHDLSSSTSSSSNDTSSSPTRSAFDMETVPSQRFWSLSQTATSPESYIGTNEFRPPLSSRYNSLPNLSDIMTNRVANNGTQSVPFENKIANLRQIRQITNYHDVLYNSEKAQSGSRSTQLNLSLPSPHFCELKRDYPTIRAEAGGEIGGFQCQCSTTPVGQYMNNGLPPLGMRVRNIYTESSQEYAEASAEFSPSQHL